MPPYTFSDDATRLDVDSVWAFLSEQAYWARWRTRDELDQQIANAWRVIGCYDADGRTVGFARAFSDGVGTAYLADVYVLPAHRGVGLGEALVRTMVEEGPGARFRWMLHTVDAHGLYERFGFRAPDPTFMERPSTLGAPWLHVVE